MLIGLLYVQNLCKRGNDSATSQTLCGRESGPGCGPGSPGDRVVCRRGLGGQLAVQAGEDGGRQLLVARDADAAELSGGERVQPGAWVAAGACGGLP